MLRSCLIADMMRSFANSMMLITRVMSVVLPGVNGVAHQMVVPMVVVYMMSFMSSFYVLFGLIDGAMGCKECCRSSIFRYRILGCDCSRGCRSKVVSVAGIRCGILCMARVDAASSISSASVVPACSIALW